MWLLLLFIVVPVLEIWLFIIIGGAIGTYITLLIILLTAILGTFLVKAQGIYVLKEIQSKFDELKNPNPNSLDDQNNIQAFKAELTLRYSMPLNIIGFSSLIAIVLLSFNYRRTESLNRTVIIFTSIILLQVVSITASNLSIKFMNMQLLNFFPSILCLFLIPVLIKKSKKI